MKAEVAMSDYPLERTDGPSGPLVSSLALCLGDVGEHCMQQAVKNTTDSYSRNITRRYRGALRYMADALEDHAVFLHVLSGLPQATQQMHSALSDGVRRRVTGLQTEMNEHLPESMMFRHMALLQGALERDDAAMLEYAMGELLCHAPDDGTVAAACAAVEGSGTAATSAALLARYRFAPQARLDCSEGAVPMALHHRSSNNVLYVADFRNHLIRRYAENGEIMAPLALGCTLPHDLFADEQGGLWVCDFGNNRLLRLGQDDAVDRVIELNPFCTGIHQGAGVRSGCTIGSTVHLVLANEKTKARFRAMLDLDEAEPQLQFVQRKGSIQPLRLFRGDNDLFMFGWPGAEAGRIHAGRRVPVAKGYLHPQVRGLVAVGGYRYLLAQNQVIKLDENGVQVFAYSLEKVLGISGCSALSMAAGRWGGNDALFVSDAISGNIFVFAI